MRIVSTGQEAREKLKKGIDLAADCIKVTLGPAGRNAVLGRLDIKPNITNDGATIARNIESEDEIEMQGVWLVREATSYADAKGGDGTTTTATLLQAIVSELFEKIKDDGTLRRNKVNVMELSKQVDEACEKVVSELQKMSRPITEEDIYNVALVAAEYPWLAEMIAEIYQKIGKDGFIKIEEGTKTKYEVYKGMELNAGLLSEYYVNNDKGQCVLEEPFVLITNQMLEDSVAGKLAEIIESQPSVPMSIIVVAPEFDRSLLNRLFTTRVKTGINIVPVKLPTFDKNDLLVDLATFSEAKFLDKALYKDYDSLLADITLTNLGKVEKAIIGGSTMLIGGNGDTTARVEEIRRVYSETESEFDKQQLEKRMAYLSGGIAILTIGGETDTERVYFKLKAEDTVNAVEGALKEGAVAGGGVALKTISETLEPNILTNAIRKPYEQIQQNAGGNLEIPETVIDPVRTTISALKTACSLASKVITTEVVTAVKNDKRDKNHD